MYIIISVPNYAHEQLKTYRTSVSNYNKTPMFTIYVQKI